MSSNLSVLEAYGSLVQMKQKNVHIAGHHSDDEIVQPGGGGGGESGFNAMYLNVLLNCVRRHPTVSFLQSSLDKSCNCVLM